MELLFFPVLEYMLPRFWHEGLFTQQFWSDISASSWKMTKKLGRGIILSI